MLTDRIEKFFALARERHSIYLRRKGGSPPPYTDDPIFQHHRFCNVFRELDKTTEWFRINVREPLRDDPTVLLATVVFRLFNRITTGEAIFKQLDLEGQTAWDAFNKTHDVSVLRAAVLQYCHPGPYVTGSFIVKTPEGMDKIDGVIDIIDRFVKGDRMKRPRHHSPLVLAKNMLYKFDTQYPIPGSLEEMHEWLERHYFIGNFQAYEIVSDLRHTTLLDEAPDIDTWANPGPGCTRGLNWLSDREFTPSRNYLIAEMVELLAKSRDPHYWPQAPAGDWYAEDSTDGGKWPIWEMREVEHTLCECFKYVRAEAGGAPPRGRFKG